MSSNGPPSETAFQLLCTLSSAALAAERLRTISSRSFAAANWEEVLHLAEHHGVLSLIARNLLDHGSGLPPEIERKLQEARRLSLQRGLWFSNELARIVRLFELEKIPVLPFKGPALAQSAYGDPGLRSFSDLDLLVSGVNVEPARRALGKLGYTPSTNMTPAVDRFWLKHGYEQSFDGPGGLNLVELQWAMLPRFYSVDLGTDHLISRSTKIIVAETEMLSLSPQDSVIALSLHAAKHLWGRLIWLVDIAETLNAQEIDYRAVRSTARQFGVARIVAVTFWLAKRLLDVKMSSIAQEMIDHDPNVAVLGQRFADRLARAATYNFASTEYFKLILKLRERPSDRRRYLWRLISTPGQSDIDAVELPERMFPLYRVVRVGRLLRKRSSSPASNR